MNREIKFRAWNGKMQYNCMAGQSICGWVEPGVGEYRYHSVAEVAVMQFTGLQDKNGKDIYEGDIVRGVFNVRTGTRVVTYRRQKQSYAIHEDKEVMGFITYEENLAAFYFQTEFKQSYMTRFWAGCGRTKSEKAANEWRETYDCPKDYLYKVKLRIEVIGNIYENPELLK